MTFLDAAFPYSTRLLASVLERYSHDAQEKSFFASGSNSRFCG